MFGRPEKEFLQALWSLQRVERPGRVLVEQVAARWRKKVSFLRSSQWRELGKRALERASRELDGIMVPHGIMHGDFAPWNTRVENGHLFVFDWESTAWDAPILWDILHFHVQTGRHVEHTGLVFPYDLRRGHDALYLLYLLNSALQFVEEEGHQALEHRYRLLLRQIA